jgi:UDP-glucose 4-epimerase
MKLAIIGGAGFLGRALITQLMRVDAEVAVTCLDRSPYSKEALGVFGLTQIIGETTSQDALANALKGADVVWIRAGKLGGPQSICSNICEDYLRENADMTAVVLDACDKAGCTRVIYDSSEQVFGGDNSYKDNRPYSEPISLNFYGASKLICEKLIFSWVKNGREKEKRSAQIFRYPRVHDRGCSDPITHMTRTALSGNSIKILGNPNRAFDFVCLQDVISANLTALKLTPEFAIYHISSGSPISLLQLANRIRNLVEEATNVNVEIEFVSNKIDFSFEPLVMGMEWETSFQELGLGMPKSLNKMIEEAIIYNLSVAS